MRRTWLGLMFMYAMQAVAQAPAASAGPGSPVSIRVDLQKSEGAYKPIYSWFGYDEANYTTMRRGRQLLAELHDLSPVPVNIRAHHLLTSGDGVAELKWSSTNVFTRDANGKPVHPRYLLNGFDASQPLHLDVREVLRQQLGDRLLPFVIRRSPAVSEALAEGMTVMDYAPETAVAGDVLNLASWLRTLAAPAPGFRKARWSEQ